MTPIAIAVTLAVVAGCGGGAPAPDTVDTGPARAPAFELPVVVGDGTVSLEESAGKLRLVDFWATWCPPCIEELPTFKELHETYGDRGLVIVGLSADTEEDDLRAFLVDHEVPWENAMADDELRAAYKVVGLPQTLLVAPDGTIAKQFPAGPVPRAVLVEWIEKLLPQVEGSAGA